MKSNLRRNYKPLNFENWKRQSAHHSKALANVMRHCVINTAMRSKLNTCEESTYTRTELLQISPDAMLKSSVSKPIIWLGAAHSTSVTVGVGGHFPTPNPTLPEITTPAVSATSDVKTREPLTSQPREQKCCQLLYGWLGTRRSVTKQLDLWTFRWNAFNPPGPTSSPSDVGCFCKPAYLCKNRKLFSLP